ncbi:tether containing UBX domain for GLUT4 [Thrips palmi]|uniref:Tether containing UBX domain for GLUT4 n=1 Tax=Thrips palmi TaxID=161013 RepID=A0A6P8ZXM8_THRPL|nr:tether containing UBX domain for GLUT4 [Thrips palmi]
MSNKCVVVLAPNGRRQNVKVTLNTTILQVIEEVCKKQGFKAEEYDITHHNKVLDATSIIRYTGLPNNAQLEMIAALKTRAESRVKVGLALESGSRVMGEFEPADSLWHVIETLCPNEADDMSSDKLPVIFYLGREESGVENLKSTTLRSLGLTSGGAILRFFKKAEDELRHQANVSAPLSKPVLPTPESLVKPSTSACSTSMSIGEPTVPESKLLQPPFPSVVEESKVSESQDTIPPSVESPRSTGNISSTISSLVESSMSPTEDIEMDLEYTSGTNSSVKTSSTQQSTHQEAEKADSIMEPEETIIFLGERNAVLFDVATARACRAEDVPDDFFDLTLDDAKQLIRDMKKRQADLQDQPLVTSQYRELEKSKHMLNALHQYKRCVIKVQFPNQLVLQGTFTPLEKVSHVMDFVRVYLHDPSIDFHIFTTPPKTILQANQTLYDANCVPGALVHLLTNAPCPENGSYIREDIMAQVSTATAAASAASAATRRERSNQPKRPEPAPKSESFDPNVPCSSGTAQVSKASNNAASGKIPKWFKK